MKMRCAALLVAFSLASLVKAAEPEIEFAGVLTAGGKTRIALTDKARKSTSWVQPGDQFNGFTVARYDPEQDAVYLTKGGREIRIGLVAARTPEVPLATANNASSPVTISAIRANLRQLAAAARQLQTERGVSSVSYADLVGPDKPIKEIKPIAGENYSTLSFGPNVTAVNVTTENGLTVALELPHASAGTAMASSATSAAASGVPSGSTPAGAPTGVTSPAAATTAPTATNTITSPGASPATSGTAGAIPPVTPTGPAATPPVSGTAATPSPDATPPDSAAVGATPAAAHTSQPTAGRQPASNNYQIQGGDTWESISAGTGVPVQQLKQLNPGMGDGAPLSAGQSIRVR